MISIHYALSKRICTGRLTEKFYLGHRTCSDLQQETRGHMYSCTAFFPKIMCVDVASSGSIMTGKGQTSGHA